MIKKISTESNLSKLLVLHTTKSLYFPAHDQIQLKKNIAKSLLLVYRFHTSLHPVLRYFLVHD
ncbi:MAG: hypothetical protein DRH04_11565 [Deltaproteobacteria bacterium]|nr:MAG: hypothetical protein DRH04_11565 [Deltaproteobacteria bacterium]